MTLLDTRRALEGLVDGGRCKAIGLSDVSLDQTKEIFEAARIKPAVVHVESHPYLPQWELLDYCRTNGIVLQAFAALGHSSRPKLLEDPVVTAIAKRVNKTPAASVTRLGHPRADGPPDHLEDSQPDPGEFSKSPPCPKTPSKRLARESRRGSDLMPLWRPGFPDSFREMSEGICVSRTGLLRQRPTRGGDAQTSPSRIPFASPQSYPTTPLTPLLASTHPTAAGSS